MRATTGSTTPEVYYSRSYAAGCRPCPGTPSRGPSCLTATVARVRGCILEEMSTTPARRRHPATSPFRREPAPAVPVFDRDDRVTHDSYGMGRVVGVETDAVRVDFGTCTMRILSPYSKLAKL